MQKQMQYWICRLPTTWPTTWYEIAVVHSTLSYCFLTSLYSACFFESTTVFGSPRATEQRLCDCRCFPLLVGMPGFLTQGKAGNQLGALRFSRGHFLQMMDAACRNISLQDYESFWNTHWVVSTAFWQHFDHFDSFCHILSVWYVCKSKANMGAFLGEACKVPFILRRFQPHWSDRCHSAVVVIATNDTVMTPNECRREFCGNAMLLQICGACVIFFSNTIAFRRACEDHCEGTDHRLPRNLSMERILTYFDHFFHWIYWALESNRTVG